jgi:DNA-binding FadR family transcriptional regulator
MTASGNRRLRELVFQFWDQTYRVRMQTLHLRPKPTESNRDHLALVEAIEKGLPEEARRIHTEHRVRAGRMLVSLLRTSIQVP